MRVRKILYDLVRTVADEAERNPDFAQRIADALASSKKFPKMKEKSGTSGVAVVKRRPKNRRPAAVLDPIAIAREGEHILQIRLARLSLEQLRDIVADYGMDPGKLVMKWKKPHRVIERIVEISIARAQKGDAFRAE